VPPGGAESSWTSETVAGDGSSIWNHMPGACAAPLSQRAPADPTGFAAASALWLAVSFHCDVLVSRAGTLASSSGSVHGVLRVVALRTAATCDGVTNIA
jgi:hypothetical protein